MDGSKSRAGAPTRRGLSRRERSARRARPRRPPVPCACAERTETRQHATVPKTTMTMNKEKCRHALSIVPAAAVCGVALQKPVLRDCAGLSASEVRGPPGTVGGPRNGAEPARTGQGAFPDGIPSTSRLHQRYAHSRWRKNGRCPQIPMSVASRRGGGAPWWERPAARPATASSTAEMECRLDLLVRCVPPQHERNEPAPVGATPPGRRARKR